MFIKKFASIAALSLSAIASFSYAESAHAVTFKVTTGIESIDGKTNQGAFSEFSKNKDVVTVDFNSGKVPTTGFAKYSFSGNNSGVWSDMWAPVGAKGEKNDSNYLEVFEGSNAIINLEKNLNYFGIDWGAAHTNNTYSFFNGDKLVNSFTTKDIDLAGGFAIYSALHPGSNEDGAKLDPTTNQYIQGNGYVHFYSESNKDTFNKIVISQVGGGGFETDNHSFHAGAKGFDFENGTTAVPEPGVALGLLAVGGLLLRKRKNQKSLNLG
ncbi:PEP-CTERM sorting domain-containing protein [Plectonema radiosum NIES-515]|uniref:PEP-CTERM sorting domain-containing protein n=1 Tax=Plectonema radiosum NIES-515 TaxID=2986073 RepID=A0ABT3B7L0_9CYAN|nr:PEP-CTERM sorting domain-containing protein [Plectonema radiosum]MCV3217324.1 PEP-CTERM sorting domain-containing protein [Plectonema radiosum NIES-515]